MGRVQSSCQGLVITGGAFDIHPAHYGQSIQARVDRIDEGRTGLELSLAKMALDVGFPFWASAEECKPWPLQPAGRSFRILAVTGMRWSTSNPRIQPRHGTLFAS